MPQQQISDEALLELAEAGDETIHEEPKLDQFGWPIREVPEWFAI